MIKFIIGAIIMSTSAEAAEKYTLNIDYKDQPIKVLVNEIPILIENKVKKGQSQSSQKDLSPYLVEGENTVSFETGTGKVRVTKAAEGSFPSNNKAELELEKNISGTFNVPKDILPKLSWHSAPKLSDSDCSKAIEFAQDLKKLIDEKKLEDILKLHVMDVKNSTVLFPDFPENEVKAFNKEKYEDLFKGGFADPGDFKCHVQKGGKLINIASKDSVFFLQPKSDSYEIYLFLAKNKSGKLEIVF
ncbi:MAG: hypothetical protein AB8E15_05800 [Bdellovibrionales bacterium]